ncbi:MAG: amino acid ABC transporter substrate-binding protein [Deltaproteobacteria bacterium]|nr:amino acid ABC transporter substrate-binding protein [Deltaproteobacteria bacterium]
MKEQQAWRLFLGGCLLLGVVQIMACGNDAGSKKETDDAGGKSVFLNPYLSSAEELIYVSTYYPPYDIHLRKGDVSGIDYDIFVEVAKRLGLKLKVIKCPWRRCLSMLEEGKADVAGAVSKKPSFEVFLHFVEPAYFKEKSFAYYFRKGEGNRVQKHEDLYKLKTIGYERGAANYKRFNEDKRLKKKDIIKSVQLFMMLEVGRLDAVLGNELTFDYLIASLGFAGKFEKAPFKYTSRWGEYLVVSKKSPHAGKLSLISKIFKEIKESGRFDSYVKKYYDHN